MKINEEHNELKARFELLLSDLDRLQLPFVAVHVDLALHRLVDYLAAGEAEFRAD